jgi:hypothetical protein
MEISCQKVEQENHKNWQNVEKGQQFGVFIAHTHTHTHIDLVLSNFSSMSVLWSQ